MTVAKTLSLSFVMIAGPQILAAIFLATTKKWRQNSLAFVAGAAASITIITTIGFLLSLGASKHGSRNGLLIAILVLLVFAAIHKFLTRKQSKPPKWMGRLEEAKPAGSFKLGFLPGRISVGYPHVTRRRGVRISAAQLLVLDPPLRGYDAPAARASPAHDSGVPQGSGEVPSCGEGLDEHQFLDRERGPGLRESGLTFHCRSCGREWTNERPRGQSELVA
jgi:hypothetical protein